MIKNNILTSFQKLSLTIIRCTVCFQTQITSLLIAHMTKRLYAI